MMIHFWPYSFNGQVLYIIMTSIDGRFNFTGINIVPHTSVEVDWTYGITDWDPNLFRISSWK